MKQLLTRYHIARIATNLHTVSTYEGTYDIHGLSTPSPATFQLPELITPTQSSARPSPASPPSLDRSHSSRKPIHTVPCLVSCNTDTSRRILLASAQPRSMRPSSELARCWAEVPNVGDREQGTLLGRRSGIAWIMELVGDELQSCRTLGWEASAPAALGRASAASHLRSSLCCPTKPGRILCLWQED